MCGPNPVNMGVMLPKGSIIPGDHRVKLPLGGIIPLSTVLDRQNGGLIFLLSYTNFSLDTATVKYYSLLREHMFIGIVFTFVTANKESS